MKDKMIHPSADVSKDTKIGKGTKIWNYVQVREGAQLGENCIVGKSSYIDKDVKIGNNVKIQNLVSVYQGVTIEDGVFVGPHVCFINDKVPRAILLTGQLKVSGTNLEGSDDWKITPTLVKKGASIGANSTILCGITIGEYAMIGAGSIVTKDVPNHALVYGNPARLKGFVCKCGNKLQKVKDDVMKCNVCDIELKIPEVDLI